MRCWAGVSFAQESRARGLSASSDASSSGNSSDTHVEREIDVVTGVDAGAVADRLWELDEPAVVVPWLEGGRPPGTPLIVISTTVVPASFQSSSRGAGPTMNRGSPGAV